MPFSYYPKYPGPHTHRVLRAQTPAMEGPTPAIRILRVVASCYYCRPWTWMEVGLFVRARWAKNATTVDVLEHTRVLRGFCQD